MKHWRPYGLASLTAGLLYWVTPPQYWYPLQWFAWIPLLWALKHASRREAFLLGFWAGTLLNGLIFYWLAPTIANFGNYPLSVSIVLMALYCGFQGLSFGLMALGTRILQTRSPKIWWLGSAALVALIELAWPKVFPWSLGWGQLGSDSLIQSASVWGMEGLTFFVILINGLLFQAIQEPKVSRRSAIFAVAALGSIGCLALFGHLRLKDEPETVQTLRVTSIQGDEPLSIRIGSSNFSRVSGYLRLTENALGFKPDLIVWPESIFTGPLGDRSWQLFSHASRNWNVPTIVGALVMQRNHHHRNTMFHFDRRGTLIATYAKRRLVPFGEGIPFADRFTFLRRFGRSTLYEAGNQVRTFQLGSVKIGPLICQDGLFPEVVHDLLGKGVDLLLYTANDSWFGESVGNDLHFMHARIRAIEYGVPVLRSGNTGYTAWIDPEGRIHNRTSLYEKVAWSHEILLYKRETLYRVLRPWIRALFVLLIALAVIEPIWQKRLG